MADEEEKTEEASPKKIEDARKEGNVPKSTETSGFITLLVAFVLIFVFFQYIVDRVEALYVYYLSFMDNEMTKSTAIAIALASAKEFALIILPIAFFIALAGIIANVSQFGFLLSAKAVQFKLSKINPISGLKNLFSLKKLLEGFQVTAKVFLMFGVGFFTFMLFIKELQTVALMPLFSQLSWFQSRALILIAVLMMLFFVLAMIDLVIKRRQYFKSLKMTKNEVKDEHKQMEGNPEVKRKIRQVMMRAAMQRMMQSVPNADVVVTNPTHYAVALRYDTEKEIAPRVLAKGVDHLALRIKEIAREHNIQIVENRSLARELYKVGEIDRLIPENLFKAVAEVFAYVHKISKNRRD